MMLFFRSVFIPWLGYNCEAWSNLSATDINSLQKSQLKYLRNMMEVANTTPIAGTFLELGILPIGYEIDLRKLTFLWRIMKKDNTDPVRQVHIELHESK